MAIHYAPTVPDVTFPGLPARPWKFTGVSRESYQAVPGDPNCPIQPGAACDHCGTGIYDCYHFTATKTGERFKVGCDCVRKMLAVVKDSNSLSAAELQARKVRNSRARVRRENKTETLRADIRTRIEANRAMLTAKPHPEAYWAGRGQTALDWAEWLATRGGLPALTKLARDLDRVLATEAA